VSAAAAWPQPYRVLFPIGVANAVIAAAVWPLHAIGLGAWPGETHRLLMMLGFEQAFVSGFLLTAMPAFTGGAPCRRFELAIPVASLLAVSVSALAAAPAIAITAWLVGLVSVLVALVRRVVRAPARPPAEFLFAALGMVLGLTGGVLLLAEATGVWAAPQPRLGIRLVSLGLVLSLVLGLGALLVPTFSGMRDPLSIPGLAAPHARGARARVYLPLVLALAGAFALEAMGHVAIGAWLRAAAGGAMLLLAWKIWRLPGRHDTPALCLVGAGWCTLIGLVMCALWPHTALAGEHLVFVGGFGLLTLGIATRVLVSHGGHALALEARVLVGPIALAVLAAVALRVAAEWLPARAIALLGASGAAWALAWLAWGLRAIGPIVRVAKRPDMVTIASPATQR